MRHRCVDGSQGGAFDAEVAVDLESFQVGLVGKDFGHPLGEGAHCDTGGP